MSKISNYNPKSLLQSIQSEMADAKSRIEQFSIQNNNAAETGQSKSDNPTFLDHLRGAIDNVDQSQKVADKMAADLATGKSENIHDTMLTLTKAELNFNLLVQVRNKALEAYQEVMRMQI